MIMSGFARKCDDQMLVIETEKRVGKLVEVCSIMMKSKSIVCAGMALGFASAALAQPYTVATDTKHISGLEQSQTSALTARLVIPFGPSSAPSSVANQARLGLSFAPNWQSDQVWTETSTAGVGLTFKGDFYADFGQETLSFEQTALMMGADEDDTKSSNTAAYFVLGAAILVGGATLLVAEVGNDVEDCFTRSDC